MNDPTSRVLTLLELLQANPRISGAELAARLGVDPRTVRRYAARLQDLGIPVQAERGRYGGYRLRPGYKLPPLMLTDQEATAVVVGLLASQRLGLSTADLAVDSALAKLHRVLPAALRERTLAVRETLGFTFPPRQASAPATAAVLALAEAARQHRRVRLTYRSWRGEQTERDLDPPQTFAAPGDFDAVAHLTQSLARVPWRHRVEVLLEATLAEARRRIPPAVATLTEADGGVLLRARAERLDGMARLLAGLDWPFVVRTPAELRAELRELAGRLSALADRSEEGH